MPRLLAVLAAAALLLAACDEPPEGAQSGPEVAAAREDGDDAMGSLPLAMQGRWGIHPADCTTTLGDDKGLLTIDHGSLTFYESRARLETVNARSDTALDADYAFSGEGMTWQGRIVLELQDDGAALVRRDFGEGAALGPLRYARCRD